MGTVRCRKCASELGPGSLQYGGPIQVCFVCAQCGSVTKMPHRGRELDEFVSAGIVRDTPEALEFERFSQEMGRKRRANPLEYWVQEYVRERCATLKFDEVEGPFATGPDFKVRKGGRWYWAEVETTWRNYLAHGHPQSKKFSAVRYLVTLDQQVSASKEQRALLPAVHVPIATNAFQRWYKPKARAYRLKKQRGAKWAILRREFHSRFLATCPDTDRDLANCPSCEMCAYFPAEDSSVAPWVFALLAVKFVGKRDIGEVRLARVRPEMLDGVYRQNLTKALGIRGSTRRVLPANVPGAWT